MLMDKRASAASKGATDYVGTASQDWSLRVRFPVGSLEIFM